MNSKTTVDYNKEVVRPLIFTSKINADSKLIPLKITESTLGKARHFPSATKEWFNSVYSYNSAYNKNIISADKSLSNIIKSYFNLYYKKTVLKEERRTPIRFKRLSTNKIFFSRAEIKHTSTKVNITLYIYNEERRLILRKISKIEKLLFPGLFSKRNKRSSFIGEKRSVSYFKTKKRSYSITRKLSLLRSINNGYKLFTFQELEKELLTIAYYKLLLKLNKSKFEDVFIRKLKVFAEKIYNKEVEFNLVNLKTLYLNSDIFTEAISLKLKNRNNKLLNVLRTSLRLVRIPVINKVKERYDEVDEERLWLNSMKNLKVNNTIDSNLDALNQTLLSIFPVKNSVVKKANNKVNIRDSVLNALKYKKIAGVRLEAKGRLTKRFTASRSLFKVKWKGGLKNIDSSYKGLSTVMLRGHAKSNLQYSLLNSKTRNGSFGLKGWVSSK